MTLWSTSGGGSRSMLFWTMVNRPQRHASPTWERRLLLIHRSVASYEPSIITTTTTMMKKQKDDHCWNTNLHHSGFYQFHTNNRMMQMVTNVTTTSQNRSFSSNNSSSNQHDQIPPPPPPPPLSSSSSSEPFVPMTAPQEEAEKLRVASLTPEQRDYELRQYNRQLAVLQMKRGINTGELYTWAGKYKALARDYGMPLLVWYWTIWAATGIVCYGTITLFDVNTIYLLQQLDAQTGFHLSEQVNPEHGKIGMALIVNEIIEPIRLPIVIVTVKPVIDQLFPPKY